MSLVVWLPLTKDLRQQGLSNVTVTNNGATFNSAGKLGGCYYFNGSNARISCSSQTWDYPLSICGWFKPTDVTNSNPQYWLSYNTASGGTAGHAIGIGTYSGKFGIWYGGTQYYSFTQTLSNDVWYHIAVTITANKTVSTYLNGELIDSRTFSSNNPGSSWFTLGARSNSSTGGVGGASYFYKGYMNDARLYNHCLSPMEVKELSKGLVLHYPLNGGGGLLRSQYDSTIYTEPDGSLWVRIFHHNNPAGSLFASTDTFTTGVYKDANRWYDVEGICNSVNKWEFMLKQKDTSSSSEVKYRWIQLHNPITATWSNVSPSSGNITHITTSGYSTSTTGAGMYKIGGNNRMTIANSNNGNWYGAIGCWTAYQGGIPGYPNTTCTSGYMDLYIRIDNLGGTTEYDCSGFCNNGTRTGIFSWTSDTPKYNVSQYFNGSSYILTDSGTFSWFNFDKCTLAAWFKPTTTPSQYIGTIGISHNQNARHKSFCIGNYAGYFTVCTANGDYINTTSNILPNNEWHHCVATLDGTTVKMYIDGALVKTYTLDWGNTALASDTRFQVGIDLPGSDEMYTGYYSDVRAYATALSASDVKSLYQNCATIDPDGTIRGQIR